MTADLIGDYLFTDSDFVNHLCTENRNVFQKIYDEIKYLCKVATAGSKEARQLEKVKKIFAEAYRTTEAKTNTAQDGGVRYAIQRNVVDTDGNVYKKVVKPGLTIYNKVKHSSHTYVDYIQNKIFPRTFSVESYDGESITVEFAKDNERFKKDGDKTPRRALGELEAADNSLKKVAVLNIKDLIKTSEPLAPNAENSHQWLDAGGWQDRIAYMRMDDTVYPVILHISKTRDGRYLLYDVSVLKNKGSTVDMNATALASPSDVGASSSHNDGSKLAVKSIEPSGEMLAQENPDVNRKNSLSSNDDIAPPRGNFHITGKDVSLEGVPIRSDITPAKPVPSLEGVPIRKNLANGQKTEAQRAEVSTKAISKPLNTYPIEKQISIRSYLKAVDERIKSFVQSVKAGNLQFKRQKIADVSGRAAADIGKLLNVDVNGYTHNINTHGVQHILIRHGENGKQDTSMAMDDDIARVGWVLENYDRVELLTNDGVQSYSSEFLDSNHDPVPQIRFVKKIDGTYYVVEAAFENSYKKLWVQSAYLQKKEDVTQTPAEGISTDHETNAQSAFASPSSSKSIAGSMTTVKGDNGATPTICIIPDKQKS